MVKNLTLKLLKAHWLLRSVFLRYVDMDVSKNRDGPPKSSICS